MSSARCTLDRTLVRFQTLRTARTLAALCYMLKEVFTPSTGFHSLRSGPCGDPAARARDTTERYELNVKLRNQTTGVAQTPVRDGVVGYHKRNPEDTSYGF